MLNKPFHTTVLKKEAIKALEIKKDHWYLDCTFGGGGHTYQILKNGGQVIAIDQDQDALDQAKKVLGDFDSDRYCLVKSNFNHLDQIVKNHQSKISGILFDLGVSSYQLTGNQRGFSFQKDEPLDMRMDPDNQTVTAKDLVNGLYEKELAQLLTEYAEEKFAKTIARHIVDARKYQPIHTTGQLRQIIEPIYQARFSTKSKINPATKTFQALRILVNDELENLKIALKKSIAILGSNGRIVVISFHSLEDRIVKSAFKQWQESNLGTILTNKPIIPSDFEKDLNPASRSAKLRIFAKN